MNAHFAQTNVRLTNENLPTTIMILFITKPISLIVPIFVFTLLATGCSNSSNNQTPNSANVTGTTDATGTTDGDISDPNNYITDEQQRALKQLFPSRETIFGVNISTVPPPSTVYEDGLAVWTYEVLDTQLINSSFEPMLSHRLPWQRFLEFVPERLVGNISEVEYQAIDLPRSTPDFIVGSFDHTQVPGEHRITIYMAESFPEAFYNSYLVNESPYYHYNSGVFIHEVAHLISAAEEVSLEGSNELPTYTIDYTRMLWDSPFRSYLQQFWEGEYYDYWEAKLNEGEITSLMVERYPDHFVSDYAATTIDEDFAESFRVFVEEDSIPEVGDYSGSAKIMWFWDQPEYVLIREQLRAVY